MQQTWFNAARCPGVFRYQWKRLGMTAVVVLAVVLATQLIALAFPLMIDMEYQFAGVQTDIAMSMMVALVVCCITANKPTRFLLRFGTPRLSVWLCNILSLIAFAIVFLVGTLLVNMLVGGLTLALSAGDPAHYNVCGYSSQLSGAALYQSSLTEALGRLPSYILYTVEWTCLFWLLGCCLRRKKALTLCVMFGVPLLLTILMLVPAIREAVSVVENADKSEMTVLGLRWLKFFANASEFLEKQWPILQFSAAVISLPLSYLCLRGTPQP